MRVLHFSIYIVYPHETGLIPIFCRFLRRYLQVYSEQKHLQTENNVAYNKTHHADVTTAQQSVPKEQVLLGFVLKGHRMDHPPSSYVGVRHFHVVIVTKHLSKLSNFFLILQNSFLANISSQLLHENVTSSEYYKTHF